MCAVRVGFASFLRRPHQEFEHGLPLLNSFPIRVAMRVNNMSDLFPLGKLTI